MTSNPPQKAGGAVRDPQQVLDEIRRVEDFTCSYWWPLLRKWQDERLRPDSTVYWDTPLFGAVCEDIIRNRSSYVRKLQDYLGSRLYYCTDLGEATYSPTCEPYKKAKCGIHPDYPPTPPKGRTVRR